MKKYVLIYVENYENQKYVLVEKKRPDWQAGWHNLVGGKVEDGENFEQAMIRELDEETGLKPTTSIEVGRILGSDYVVSCWTVYSHGEINPRFEEDEKVFWTNWEESKQLKLLSNLQLLVPLCKSKVLGWTLDYSEGISYDEQILVLLNYWGWER